MSKEITVFAETNYRNNFRKFGIKTDDRRRHMYLIGKTGMGKSTALENMIIEDIRDGKGVAVVDPHGDLAEKIIEFIPSDRINDVIYFNPADMDYPFAFNVVEQVEPHLRYLVASGLVGVFQKLWADSWGPRLEYILRNTILAVLDYPGSTLLAVTRMLSDKAFRKRVIAKIQDPVVKAFWVNEFAGYADKFASEAVSPIQNKVGQFLSSSLIRNIVGQVKSSIDMRDIMDNGKILIMNLSKGRIGEDNSSLLGSMMITKIQLAAMSRVDLPEKDRKDFYLYVDEFQNFVSDSFANILSEARKYRLNLVLAHQYIEQLSETVKPAVFGNVGTMVVFRVGAADAEELVKEFTPVFEEEDIVNIPKFQFFIKLMIDGISSDPFSGRGLPPLLDEEKTGNLEKIINVGRERYAKKREVVVDKITRWTLGTDEEEGSQVNRESKQPKLDVRDGQSKQVSTIKRRGREEKRNSPRLVRSEDRSQEKKTDLIVSKETELKKENSKNNSQENKSPYQHDANCARCGQTTKTSFEPDGLRPIFCKECLSNAKKTKNSEIERRRKHKEEELKKINKSDENSEKELSLDEILRTNIKKQKSKNKPAKKFHNNEIRKSERLTGGNNDGNEIEEDQVIVFK